MPLSPRWRRIYEPSVGGYQPNVPLNAQAARLGAKGKAFLQAMAGEFGALEGKYGLPAGLLSSVAATESGGDPFAVSKLEPKACSSSCHGTAKDMGLKGRDVYDPTSQLMPLQDTCAICWMPLAAIWKNSCLL
jgi:soluble lytic murein transglycosylase-like protein